MLELMLDQPQRGLNQSRICSLQEGTIQRLDWGERMHLSFFHAGSTHEKWWGIGFFPAPSATDGSFVQAFGIAPCSLHEGIPAPGVHSGLKVLVMAWPVPRAIPCMPSFRKSFDTCALKQGAWRGKADGGNTNACSPILDPTGTSVSPAAPVISGRCTPPTGKLPSDCPEDHMRMCSASTQLERDVSPSDWSKHLAEQHVLLRTGR
jgi:hypothetical protein